MASPEEERNSRTMARVYYAPYRELVQIGERASVKEYQFSRANEQQAAWFLRAGHTRAEAANRARSRDAGLLSHDAVQAKRFTPAPPAGTGAVEDGACLVSGRTDSITR
jgi:hypothetical protein